MTKRVALVTGSGKKRVGWHVANALGNKGYEIVLHYRSSEKEAKSSVQELISQGVQAIALRADLTSEKEVRRLLCQIIGLYREVTLNLVNL